MTGWGQTRLSDEFPGRPLHGPPRAAAAMGSLHPYWHRPYCPWGQSAFCVPACPVRPRTDIRPNARAYEKTAQLGGANLAAEGPVDADRVERDDRQDHDPAVEQEFERDVRHRCVGQRRAM